ncbi:MAG: Co2+/Mg2+ efflux protein ApaG [Sphingobacteriaceae bacterium]|nr:Co2+/Mg2+ efflux protein ApaG [Sphingobacteriaceae bacterium]
MVSHISNGFKISVVVFYNEKMSEPEKNIFLFEYKISIQNLTDKTLQLKRRKWFIFDSKNETKIVEGEGVVGLMPPIDPQSTFSYSSACALTTDIGEMKGFYTFRDLSGYQVDVEIPTFQLISSYRLN